MGGSIFKVCLLLSQVSMISVIKIDWYRKEGEVAEGDLHLSVQEGRMKCPLFCNFSRPTYTVQEKEAYRFYTAFISGV